MIYGASFGTKCKVIGDGEEMNKDSILICTCVNGKYVGGSYKCAPRSVNNDGFMEVCCIKPVSIFKFLKFFSADNFFGLNFAHLLGDSAVQTEMTRVDGVSVSKNALSDIESKLAGREDFDYEIYVTKSKGDATNDLLFRRR